jgi:hypothetical protein
MHLCEFFFFIFIQCRFHPAAFSNVIFTATGLLTGGLTSGLPSPMYKNSEPYEGFPVVDLSFGEENDFLDTSGDEEIARKFFVDLNHDILGPLGDGNIIILNNSDEEEEVRDEDHADVEAASSSAVKSLAPTASTAIDNVTPEEVQGDSSDGGDEAGNP